MGESYFVANHDLREFFNPLALGEANKLRGILGGRFTTLAVGLLVTRSKAEALRSTWAGRWAACEVEVVGEYDFEVWERLHREYADVGHAVITMPAAVAPGAIGHFVALVGQDSLVAVQVGNAVFHDHSEPLKQALEQRFGTGWTKQFKKAYADCPCGARGRAGEHA